ncbi:hypothetical protein [Streptomyces sp. bgisy034]|uniref:hypothetical protein n=1 Tax=Streptomyces sp. bgisy034 TaxID=3413774 RepID=UPI003EBDD322
MSQPAPLTDEQLNDIDARVRAAMHCPNAEANGRLDGQHTLSGSFSHIRCELCTYTRPRGERVEETAALLAEVRRQRDEVATHTRGVLRRVADMADPEAPEVSFFGGMVGPSVAAWLRMIGDHPETVERLAAASKPSTASVPSSRAPEAPTATGVGEVTR